MSRLISLFVLVALHTHALAYSVALTHGTASGPVPAAGDLLFNQQLYWIAPGTLIGRTDGHHALPGGDGDPNPPRTYFFRFSGVTVRAGAIYLRSFDGVVGFVGQVGDAVAGTPFDGARRVLMAPGTKLDVVGDRFDVLSYAVPGEVAEAIELAGTLDGAPLPANAAVTDSWLTVSDQNVSQIGVEVGAGAQHRVANFRLDWRLVRGPGLTLPAKGNPVFYWDGKQEIFIGIAPQSFFGYRVQLAPNVHIIATADGARLVIDRPATVARVQKFLELEQRI